MYFGLSEDQKFFQENVSKFLEDQSNLDVIRKITEGEANEIQQEIHDGLVNLGLGSLLIPEQYGGLGLDLLFATAVSQSLGEGLGPIPFAGSYIMAPLAIMHGGNHEQKNNYLTKMSENSMRIGVGFSEYIGARDNANISINDNKISGRALFVIDAKDASHLMLSDKNGMIGIVESSSSGIEITELVAVDKTRNFLEVQLKDVDIDILELTSTSKEAIDKSIDAGRIILAADSLGASQALIDKASMSVNGVVRLKLYKGNIIITGRKSENSLYDESLVTFEDSNSNYDQTDAKGFIKLNALRLIKNKKI